MGSYKLDELTPAYQGSPFKIIIVEPGVIGEP